MWFREKTVLEYIIVFSAQQMCLSLWSSYTRGIPAFYVNMQPIKYTHTHTDVPTC